MPFVWLGYVQIAESRNDFIAINNCIPLLLLIFISLNTPYLGSFKGLVVVVKKQITLFVNRLIGAIHLAQNTAVEQGQVMHLCSVVMDNIAIINGARDKSFKN
ncbi:hypothetical protein [Coxiella-like endosymbiont]|uniref:hypothetical protein n=1 Tax=Coxiella-like endosymbiont TaxID=1592897 RepID=UPI00272CDDB9|nr:hypothetical protein [Coxiella-like endosymbiont]